jgi:hypothetical protein
MTPSIRKYKLSHSDVADILQNFLDGTGDPLAWDGFTLGMSFDEERLEKIRIRCAGLSQEFPPSRKNEYCNEQGGEIIRDYIKQLRHMHSTA